MAEQIRKELSIQITIVRLHSDHNCHTDLDAETANEKLS